MKEREREREREKERERDDIVNFHKPRETTDNSHEMTKFWVV